MVPARGSTPPNLGQAARGDGDTTLDWSWDWGWDEEFGGIINFRDRRNFPPQDYSQDMKFGGPSARQ